MRVAGYIRCSTSKQDLESQRYTLTEWARKGNHTITLYEDFAISGKKEEREALTRLMIDGREKKFDAVAGVEISRFGRSIKIIYSVVEELTKLGIKIILATSNTILDYNSLEGRALIGGLALASDIEWMLIQERNRRGREKIKRDKIKVGRKKKEDKGLSIEAIKSLREKGLSMRLIGKELNTSPATIMRILHSLENGHKMNIQESKQNDTQNT